MLNCRLLAGDLNASNFKLYLRFQLKPRISLVFLKNLDNNLWQIP